MKNILTLILLLLPLLAMPQSTESNQLYNQSLEFSQAGQYEEAIALLKKSDSLDKIQLDPSHKNYHRAEYGIAVCETDYVGHFFNERKIDEAIKHQTTALNIFKRILGEDSPEYSYALSDLSMIYNEAGDLAEAIRLGNDAANISKKIFGEEHPKYATVLHHLSHCYSDAGNFGEWSRLANAALEIYKKTLGDESPEYANALNDIALYNLFLGNNTEAIRLETIIANINKKAFGEESDEYAFSLHNLAGFYGMIGDYTEAIRLETMALNIRKVVWGEEHSRYASSLSNLASFNESLGNTREALRLEQQAVEICKKYFGEDNLRYANNLDKLAWRYYDIDNYAESIRLENIAVDICKKSYGEQSHLYADKLSSLALFYSKLGKHADAIRLTSSCMKIYSNDANANPSQNAIVQKNAADVYFAAGHYDKATELYQQCYTYKINYVLQNFATMTTKERGDFWQGESNLISNVLPRAAYKISSVEYDVSTKNTLNTLTYNGLLLSKGLLLNAELEIQKLIDQSGDTKFANRYYQIRQNRVILDNLYQIPAENRTADLDALKKIIDDEERALVQSSKALGDYTKNLSISWQDVQNNLKASDVAIEFVDVQDTAQHWVYAALVLKKGMKCPEFVTLFDSDQFWNIMQNEYYQTTKLTNLVWQPLAKYLASAKRVFFSPTGRLHTIGIEYLPDEDGTLFAEKYETYRLSSTRELTMAHSVNTLKKATTYGGIRYEFTPDEWQMRNGNDEPQNNFRDIPQLSNTLRGRGMAYLEGTKIESESIAGLLQKAKYNVTAFSDADATEESFKQLSGTGLQILHIGTHGFYETETDLENAGLKFYTESKQSSMEDRSLSCSGLLFAGANSAIDPRRNKEIPEGINDGILTAKEISRLDFNGLDLVVLSACQTGLGAITGEGVFGLQRGFKKAGAQTIVMSLWSVSDESTQLLMVEFFKNLTAGQSKRAAFLSAQKVVREKYPDPMDWAAFIMVDAF